VGGGGGDPATPMFPLAALSPLLGRKHRGAKELEGDGSSF